MALLSKTALSTTGLNSAGMANPLIRTLSGLAVTRKTSVSKLLRKNTIMTSRLLQENKGAIVLLLWSDLSFKRTGSQSQSFSLMLRTGVWPTVRVLVSPRGCRCSQEVQQLWSKTSQRRVISHSRSNPRSLCFFKRTQFLRTKLTSSTVKTPNATTRC